jgi:endonuclease III
MEINNNHKFSDEKCTKVLLSLRDKYDDDEEVLHMEADDFLCEILKSIGFPKTAAMFDSLPKYYA